MTQTLDAPEYASAHEIYYEKEKKKRLTIIYS